MKKITKSIRYLLGLPKSIYISFKLCSLSDAIHLPIIVSHKTKLANLTGKVTLGKVKTGIIRVGFGSVETYDFSYERTILSIPGHIHFEGKAKIGLGSRISISGIFYAGNNFHISAASTLIVRNKLSVGENSLIAWECIITDADHHHILDKSGAIVNPPEEITIGKNVWIGARTMILKGSRIPNGCVIGAQSLISKSFEVEKTLIAGNPAKIIKKNIHWCE